LHHRFTLIHPFADGNGRVARCLATLILLRQNWFPLVVTRGDRTDYLSALREADQGDLAPLVLLFGGLQKRAIKHAMSLSEEVERGSAAIRAILTRVRDKFDQDRTAIRALQQKVFAYGNDLMDLAQDKLKGVEGQINLLLGESKIPNYHVATDRALPNEAYSDRFGYQIDQYAKELGYFANLQDYCAWCRLVVSAGARVEILFAFHGIGREFNGTLVCSAMAYRKLKTEQTDETADLRPLSWEPFYFAYGEPLSQINDRFSRWIDRALVEGLDYWRKAIGA
jgi:hypothetical protein